MKYHIYTELYMEIGAIYKMVDMEVYFGSTTATVTGDRASSYVHLDFSQPDWHGYCLMISNTKVVKSLRQISGLTRS